MPDDATQKHYRDLLQSGQALGTAQGQIGGLYDPVTTGQYANEMLSPQYNQIYNDYVAKLSASQAAKGGVGLRGNIANRSVTAQLAPQMAGQVAGYQLSQQKARQNALSSLYNQNYSNTVQGATGAYSPNTIGGWTGASQPQQQQQGFSNTNQPQQQQQGFSNTYNQPYSGQPQGQQAPSGIYSPPNVKNLQGQQSYYAPQSSQTPMAGGATTLPKQQTGQQQTGQQQTGYNVNGNNYYGSFPSTKYPYSYPGSGAM